MCLGYRDRVAEHSCAGRALHRNVLSRTGHLMHVVGPARCICSLWSMSPFKASTVASVFKH